MNERATERAIKSLLKRRASLYKQAKANWKTFKQEQRADDFAEWIAACKAKATK